MAIINSLAIGRARKSAGNITFRTVRGRCIASQKVSTAGTRVTTLSLTQALFSLVNTFMQLHGTDIDVSFNKSKYGSARNYFFTKNKSALRAALTSLMTKYISSGMKPTATEIDKAVGDYAASHPNAIYRVSLTGFDPVFMTGAWTSNDNPVSGGGVNDLGKGTVTASFSNAEYKAPCAISLNFASGARIQRGAGNVTIDCVGVPADVSTGDISFLTSGGSTVQALSVTSVTSTAAGRLVYVGPAITAAHNVVAVKVKSVYIRLTSAYVKQGDNQEGSPLA